jgi:hypothetical protein
MFGDLRSVAHSAPSEAAWGALCALVSDPVWAAEPGLWREEVFPYLEAALASWPDGLRFAPQAWGEAIAAGRRCPGLELACRLTVAGVSLGNRGAFRLAQAPELQGLTHLTLWLCEIGQEGARQLALTPYLGRLHTLDMRRNAAADEGAAALATSESMAALRVLVLQDNVVGDLGAQQMASSPQLKRLQRLNLCDNQLTYAGLDALQRSEYAQGVALELEGNAMDETLAARLVRPGALRQWMWEAVSRLDRLWMGGAPQSGEGEDE